MGNKRQHYGNSFQFVKREDFEDDDAFHEASNQQTRYRQGLKHKDDLRTTGRVLSSYSVLAAGAVIPVALIVGVIFAVVVAIK